MQAKFFQRYVWLLSTISSAGEISKREIDRRWARSPLNENYEMEYPKRTFLRHKQDIEEIFGIEIEYKRSRDIYRIANSEDMQTDKVRHWLLNTFVVNNALTESQSLRQRILTEEIPEGHQLLPTIIQAMRDNRVLLVEHARFGNESKTIMLDPYCLKVFKQRWYVYGRPSDHPKERRIYALDRILRLQETDKNFRLPKDFDAEAEFSNYYGVFSDKPVERVRVRINKIGAPYLRSLPLHHSQEEIFTGEEYSEFTYFISPTFDFVQQLRTYGSQLVVLEPQWLRKEMQAEAEAVVKAYEE